MVYVHFLLRSPLIGITFKRWLPFSNHIIKILCTNADGFKNNFNVLYTIASESKNSALLYILVETK